MWRRFLALVCVLMAAVAAPQGDLGRALDKAFGVASCGGESCCCHAARGGNCCDGSEGGPRLVSGCRCGHHDDGTPDGAPEMPRLCSIQAASLPDMGRSRSVQDPSTSVVTRRPLAPEPPPPRLRD
jgi:hypothetical protein